MLLAVSWKLVRVIYKGEVNMLVRKVKWILLVSLSVRKLARKLKCYACGFEFSVKTLCRLKFILLWKNMQVTHISLLANDVGLSYCSVMKKASEIVFLLFWVIHSNSQVLGKVNWVALKVSHRPCGIDLWAWTRVAVVVCAWNLYIWWLCICALDVECCG